jgi:hypothetical protein
MRTRSYQKIEEQRNTRIELGRAMFDIRNEALVMRRELARYLGISDPYLLDMEVGNRTYQEKYVDDAIDYCLKAKKRNEKLIKNQKIKQ